MFSVISDMEAQEPPDMDKAVEYVKWLLKQNSSVNLVRRNLSQEEQNFVLSERTTRELLTRRISEGGNLKEPSLRILQFHQDGDNDTAGANDGEAEREENAEMDDDDDDEEEEEEEE
jgi:hypothetical protein